MLMLKEMEYVYAAVKGQDERFAPLTASYVFAVW